MSDNHRRRRPLARALWHPGIAGSRRGLDRRPAGRVHTAVRMALPADQLSRVPPPEDPHHVPWRVPLQTGKPTTPEPGDLHAAGRLTDAVADRAESALGAAAMSTATLAGRPRQRASALARSPGHGRGQFELDTVRVFKGKHVNPERRRAGDLAVRCSFRDGRHLGS